MAGPSRRDEAARAALAPYEPGERPLALTIAAGLALALGVANLVLWQAGWKINGTPPSTGGVVVFSVLMLMAAGGMWAKRYWAVLGFEALLGISATWGALALLRANNLEAVGVSLATVTICGTLFYRLIRVMGRLQVPRRPARER